MPSSSHTAAEPGGAGAESVTDPAENRPVEAAGAAGAAPHCAKPEQSVAAGLADGAFEPAVRGQIQRVRLDLLSRETERLEQQLRQVREQQHEDRQLREELRAQLADLGQRMELMLAGGPPQGAGRGDRDADLRTAVKPLLQEILRMLDNAGSLPSDNALPSSHSSPSSGSVWSQVDAAREAGRGMDPATPEASTKSEPVTREAAAPVRAAAGEAVCDTSADVAADAEIASEAETVSCEPAAAQPGDTVAEVSQESPTPAPEKPAEEASEPDPDEELRIEIARLLRPKDSRGRYGPLPGAGTTIAKPERIVPEARAAGQPAADAAPTPESAPEPAPEPAAEIAPETAAEMAAEAQEPLVLGTDATPEVDRPAGASSSTAKPAADRTPQAPDAEPDARENPADDGTVRRIAGSASAAKRSQRPSWAPRPNPMRASLPKCLTEPWDEPEAASDARKGGARWPFRRTRSGGA